jgi:uncharacterized protein DUF4124
MPYLAIGRTMKGCLRVAGLLLACAALPAAAAVYKWVDAKGVTHYSETPPPPETQATTVNVMPSAAPGGSASDTWRDRDLEARKQRIEKSQAEDRAKAANGGPAARKERCLDARRQLDILAPGRPVYEVNEKGERVFLDDKTRDLRLAEYKKRSETYCEP